MGCGVSRFNKDELAGPAYLYYNPVHRQTDDLGPWRHKADRAATVDLASTKQPLMEDADSATDKGAARNDPFNVDGCIMKLPPMPQQMMKAEGSEVAVAAKEEEGKALGGSGGNDNNGKEAKANEEDRETRSSNKESSIFYPGSPSFREYCFSSNNTSADADSSSINNNNDVGVLNGYVSDDDRGEPDKYHQRRDSFTFKTAKEEGIPPAPDFIEKPDEPERTQLEEKKGRRRSRRFRVGLPRNSSTGVRSIWHVTSCSPQRTAAGKAAS